MLLKNYSKLLLIFFNLYLIVITISPLLFTTFNCNFIDISLRCRVSESFISGLYFLWTNSSYLYYFGLLTTPLLLSVYIRASCYMANCYILLHWTLLIMFLILVLNTFFNSYNFPHDAWIISWNLLLNNPINKIHPALFFIALFLLILVIDISIELQYLSKLSYVMLGSILLLFLSLFLGSWWAYQEGSWGGWWDWDASEFLSLILMWALTQRTHAHKITQLTRVYSNVSNQTLLTPLFFFLLLQVSLSVVSHNFGFSSQGTFVFISYLLTILYVMLMFSFTFLARIDRSVTMTDYTHQIYYQKLLIRSDTLNALSIFLILTASTVIFLSYAILLSSSTSHLLGIINTLLPSRKFAFMVIAIIFIMFVFSRISYKYFIFIIISISSFLDTGIVYYVLISMLIHPSLQFLMRTSRRQFVLKPLLHILFYLFSLTALFSIFNLHLNKQPVIDSLDTNSYFFFMCDYSILTFQKLTGIEYSSYLSNNGSQSALLSNFHNLSLYCGTLQRRLDTNLLSSYSSTYIETNSKQLLTIYFLLFFLLSRSKSSTSRIVIKF